MIERNQNAREFLTRFLSGHPTNSDINLVDRRSSVIVADIVQARFPADPHAKTNYLRERGKHTTIEYLQETYASQDPLKRVYTSGLLTITHPEVVLPLGYDEVRYNAPLITDPSVSESVAGVAYEAAEELSEFVGAILIDLFKGTQYRSPDGVWHDLEGVLDRLLPNQTEPGKGERRSNDEWAQLFSSTWLTKLSKPKGGNKHTVILPFLSSGHSGGDSQISLATQSILWELHQNQKSLADLHWRTLEELVAELLHGLGLEVHVTKRSADGGRDVIARGELIPGEPVLLAVEVKQKSVVGVRDLRDALWANRHFPALLFATSGRFSAGVYRERTNSETNLRLILKDGRGLEQWIDQYVRQSYKLI